MWCGIEATASYVTLSILERISKACAVRISKRAQENWIHQYLLGCYHLRGMTKSFRLCGHAMAVYLDFSDQSTAVCIHWQTTSW